jgi:hypothetical protein
MNNLTPEQAQSEMLKCQSDPVYWFNNYTAQGREKPITKEDWDEALAYLRLKYAGHFKRNRPPNDQD